MALKAKFSIVAEVLEDYRIAGKNKWSRQLKS